MHPLLLKRSPPKVKDWFGGILHESASDLVIDALRDAFPCG